MVGDVRVYRTSQIMHETLLQRLSAVHDKVGAESCGLHNLVQCFVQCKQVSAAESAHARARDGRYASPRRIGPAMESCDLTRPRLCKSCT